MQRLLSPYIVLALILAVIAVGFVFFSSRSYHKEITLSNERELKATLEAGFAKLTIARGKSSVLFESNVSVDNNTDITKYIEYSIRDRVGYLNINTSDENEHKKKSFHISNFDTGTWNTFFSDEVPISFDVELGLGKGDFDFSGLSVKDLSLSAGASKVSVRFDKPNKSEIEDLTIEAGLSNFDGKNLGNANFKHMKFEGGVGTYRLDFGGRLEKEVDVDIEIGLGSLTVIIPHEIGAKVAYEKSILAHLDIDREFNEQAQDNYVSSNYYSSTGKINLHIEAGLGSVKIRRD